MILLLASFPIFKARWVGIGVQGYTAPDCIVGMLATGPDTAGYIYLNAISRSGDTVPVIRARWKGIFFQSFVSSTCLRGFGARSDTGGYIYLSAYTDGDTSDILRSRWVGTYVQEYNAYPCYVKGFAASSDTGGVAVLSVDTTCAVDVAEARDRAGRFEVLGIEGGERLKVKYSVPRTGKVEISLYNASGRLVGRREVLRDRGTYSEVFSLPDGLYFVVVRFNGQKVVMKAIKKGGRR